MSQDRPFKVKCKCGQNKTNFKNNIGSFYIDTCCTVAGYNHLGLKKGEKEESPAKVTTINKSPSEVLDKRKEEKEALQQQRSAEISKRKAERDARTKEKLERASKLEEEHSKKVAIGSGKL